MSTSQATRALVKGDYVTIDGERMKIGLLGPPGNARLDGKGKVVGFLAVVQWYHHSYGPVQGEKLEKIAYNVLACTREEAEAEMEKWIPRLQFPEHKETSKLVRIAQDEGTLA